MPSHEDRSSDNTTEHTNNVVHGAGVVDSDIVDRASKTATPPVPEKGAAIPGLGASGGGLSLPDKGDQGKGPNEPLANTSK